MLTEIGEIEENVKLKTLENENQQLIEGSLDSIGLNISEDIINKYKDIVYVKDSKLYLSFIANFPETELYKKNKDIIEKLKNKLETNNESIKSYNKVINSSFDDELNGYNVVKSHSKVDIKNENGNKYVHMDMKYIEGGYTTYISQYIENVAKAYNDKLYINVKFRNSYANSKENLVINNSIIRVMRNQSGYNETILNSDKYIEKYNMGWSNASFIRTVLPQHNTFNLSIWLGGDSARSSSWEYIIDFDDIYIINLTEIFGAGNEPTQAEMDEMFNNF